MTENALVQCLGEDFAKLPLIIQAAHHGRIRLSGTAEITRGRGVGGWLAGMLGMPRDHPACPMEVDGDHQAEAMRWSRYFNGRKMESVFGLAGPHLVESLGPIKLCLRPVVEDERLVYRLESARIGPLPLPAKLRPHLTAWEGEADGQYDFNVDVGLPLIGRVIRYRGRLSLQPPERR